MELLTVATTLPVIVFDVGDSAALALAREALDELRTSHPEPIVRARTTSRYGNTIARAMSSRTIRCSLSRTTFSGGFLGLGCFEGLSFIPPLDHAPLTAQAGVCATRVSRKKYARRRGGPRKRAGWGTDAGGAGRRERPLHDLGGDRGALGCSTRRCTYGITRLLSIRSLLRSLQRPWISLCVRCSTEVHMSIDDPNDSKLSSEPTKNSQRRDSQPHDGAVMLAASAGGAL
jgi:hypothetical protein